jgi:predicted nucleotidyltransferase
MPLTVEVTKRNKTRELLKPMLLTLQEQLGERLVAIVLFGSRARNEAKVESDWDLLLIADDLPQKALDRHLFVKQLLPIQWRSVVSILAKTPDEFDAAVQALYLDIAVDGMILADTQNYVTKRLAFLKRQLAERGLYRVREGSDMIWRWQEAPQGNWSIEWEEAPA